LGFPAEPPDLEALFVSSSSSIEDIVCGDLTMRRYGTNDGSTPAYKIIMKWFFLLSISLVNS
jgi:hypothetical protein